MAVDRGGRSGIKVSRYCVTTNSEYIEKSGRLFAIGVSQQQLSNVGRAVCANQAGGGNTVDVDFVFCVISVMRYLCRTYVPSVEEGRLFVKMAEQPAQYKAFVTEYYASDVADTKAMLYRALFGGIPHDGNPLLWAVYKASRVVWEAF